MDPQPPTGATSRAWRALWRAAQSVPAAEQARGADLGQYAALSLQEGPLVAASAFPHVAAHLAGGCRACHDDLQELLRVLGAESYNRPGPDT